MKKRRVSYRIKRRTSSTFSFRSTRRVLRKSLKKSFIFFLGFALAPAIYAAGKGLVLMIPNIASEGLPAWWIYLSGAFAYLALERWAYKPTWFYVLGHELTHACAGLLSGAKVHSIEATSEGGEVKLSKSNGFVALAPYIVPFYALIVIGVYAALKRWIPGEFLYRGFQFSLGFTLAFHISFTIQSIHRSQSDLKVWGFFFSGTLIAFSNLVILGLFFVGLFQSTPSLKGYGQRLLLDTGQAWRWSWKGAQSVYHKALEINRGPIKEARVES